MKIGGVHFDYSSGTSVTAWRKFSVQQNLINAQKKTKSPSVIWRLPTFACEPARGYGNNLTFINSDVNASNGKKSSCVCIEIHWTHFCIFDLCRGLLFRTFPCVVVVVVVVWNLLETLHFSLFASETLLNVGFRSSRSRQYRFFLGA